MISYREALEIVLRNAKPISKEEVRIQDAVNRYIIKDIRAPFDIPRFDNSAMDGYAIKSQDTRGASKDNPVRLRVSGEIKTGESSRRTLKTNEAFSISTGSKIPFGADSVVMKEDVELQDGYILISREIRKGENIRFKGEEFKKGEVILKKGTEITPSVVGLLALCGFERIKVYRLPVIGFVSSGTELVEPGGKVQEHQIYNSNYYSISSLLRVSGFDVNYYGIVRDNYREARRIIEKAVEKSDVVLISGGVSVGDVDYIKEVLRDLKVKELFWRVRIKPGKPVFFGKKGNKIIFGLPGNPVSSFVNSFLFVIPLLKKMVGAESPYHPEFSAILQSDLHKRGDRLDFVRGVYESTVEGIQVRVLGSQGSHMMGGLADANCLIITDESERIYKKGEKVRIYKLW